MSATNSVIWKIITWHPRISSVSMPIPLRLKLKGPGRLCFLAKPCGSQKFDEVEYRSTPVGKSYKQGREDMAMTHGNTPYGSDPLNLVYAPGGNQIPRCSLKSWLRRRTEKALSGALMRAYKTVRVEPERFLIELRANHGLAVGSFQGMYSLDVAVLDELSQSVIRSAMKLSAAEGAGFGIGGCLPSFPTSVSGRYHYAHDSEAQSDLWLRIQYRR